MAPDPYRYFRVEAREIVEQVGKGMLELERGTAAPELVARLLRLAHTLKGAARVVKQREIADHAHAIEDVLAPLRDGAAALPRERIDAVLKRLDEIAARVDALDAPPAPAPAMAPLAQPGPAQRGPAQPEPPRPLRADAEELDELLDGVVEASVQLASMRSSLGKLERARRLAELLDDHIGAPRSSRTIDGTAKLRSMTGELRTIIATLERGVAGGIDQLERELRQVRDAGERLRLMPVSVMFGALERSARDAARSVGRRIVFAASGGDVRFDAHVLPILQRALVQAVRNAVAHGIEPEADRASAGKSPDGRITVEVERRGKEVAFSCRDDGRGVDLEAVRRAAQRSGIESADIRQLGADQLMELLLRGGLSTSSAVTDVAGRGVGLDVVRDAANRLGGSVRVHSQPGLGTTLELVVPLTLSALDVLVVEASGQAVGIPLEAIVTTMRVGIADVTRTADGASVLYEGAMVPFVAIDRALRSDGKHELARAVSAVVVRSAHGRAAIGVDRLRGTMNVVMRPTPELAVVDPVVAGVSLDAEGNPQLVLAAEGLIEVARRASSVTAPEIPRPPVLVIDDSITTRMLEQSILESAGYEVDVASSGEEGLERARSRRYALFLVDVEMPGMSGYDFVERTRADAELRHVPAVLVTSRGSAEDRQKGAAVGAAAYIVKSEFDQVELLERIRTLVEAR